MRIQRHDRVDGGEIDRQAQQDQAGSGNRRSGALRRRREVVKRAHPEPSHQVENPARRGERRVEVEPVVQIVPTACAQPGIQIGQRQTAAA